MSGSHEGLEGRRQVRGGGGAGKARIDNAQRKWRKLEEVISVFKGSSPALRQHKLVAYSIQASHTSSLNKVA